MYYAKFKNGQILQDDYYIQISNNIVILSNGTNIVIIKEGVLNNGYVYLPLEEDNAFYYVTFTSNAFKTKILGSVKGHTYEENVDFSSKVVITDENFNDINEYYYYIVGYNTTSSLIVLKNPNQVVTKNNDTYTSTKPVTVYASLVYDIGTSGSTTYNQNANLSTLLNNLITNGKTSYPLLSTTTTNLTYQIYIGALRDSKFNKSTYEDVYIWQNFILSVTSFNVLYLDSILPINPLGIYDTIEQDTKLTYSTGISNIYLYLKNDLDTSIFSVYQGTNGILIIRANQDNIYFNKNEVVVLRRYSYNVTDNKVLIPTGYYSTSYDFGSDYQYEYTPTNKLKTVTIESQEVQHNEDTGTYALTFKINNPNEVSVSCNIHISGREDVTDITVPSGTSEWSYILDENKDGTIQATDISALGYENADDSAVYKYYAYIEPGYLRELTISSCFLSTTDDKNYTLNVLVDNSNSVTIPAVLHYGSTAQNTMNISIKSGINVFTIRQVDNTNGIVWIHPDKVEGYYQLPDTDRVSYTKLPIPPAPSSTGITLYKNNNNNKVVNKGYKLETYKVLNGTFRDKVNILNPVFQIENNEVPVCNYCYIADFRRYYYIDTITCVRTGIYEITCSVDVLYTYKDNILSSEQYISRQENEYDELLVDNMVTFDEDYTYVVDYKNIDELDYASNSIDNKASTDKTNIVLCVYGQQTDIV